MPKQEPKLNPGENTNPDLQIDHDPWKMRDTSLKTHVCLEIRMELEANIDEHKKMVSGLDKDIDAIKLEKARLDCKSVKDNHEKLTSEKEELANALANVDLAVQDIKDKTTSMEEVNNDLLKQIEDIKIRVCNEKHITVGLEEERHQVISDAAQLSAKRQKRKKEYERKEKEKNNMDCQIASLHSKLKQRKEMVKLLNKEVFGEKDDKRVKVCRQIVKDNSGNLGKEENSADEGENEVEENRKRRREAQTAKLNEDLNEVLVSHEWIA